VLAEAEFTVSHIAAMIKGRRQMADEVDLTSATYSRGLVKNEFRQVEGKNVFTMRVPLVDFKFPGGSAVCGPATLGPDARSR
jgi:hypothetical protein